MPSPPRWRIWLLSICAGILIILLSPISPWPGSAGLDYFVKLVTLFVPTIAGLILGAIFRVLRIRLATCISVIALITAPAISTSLWSQYVPTECRTSSLQVKVAGTTVLLPAEIRPRLERGKEVVHFGNHRFKRDFAYLCRAGRNGTASIAADVIWISPVSSHEGMTAACSREHFPSWCVSYSSSVFPHIRKVILEKATTAGLPLHLWYSKSSRVDREGDLREGSVCRLADDGSNTECTMWKPFGDSHRLTVSSYNLDDTYAGMAADDVRQMLRQVRSMTLSLIGGSSRH